MENKWLDVAKLLEKGEKNIKCPFCDNSYLKIVKILRPDQKYDVYVSCLNCKSHTVFSGVDK